ncbi:hypothetical protein N8371_08755 [Vicingaceae bacterium]|nr:hypothetical protein [Vicingaceae bacterium]
MSRKRYEREFHDHESRNKKDIKTFSLYNRKLMFCKDIGFDNLCDAIIHFGNHRIFNKKFDEVSSNYTIN